MTEIFEILMLACFGASWPLNIIKSLRSRSTKRKSLFFLILIDAGYVCGIINKLLRYQSADNRALWTFALCVYILNLLMVSGDLILYFINRQREKSRGSETCPAGGK